MKMKKDDVVIECDNLTKNIWVRNGFEEIEDIEDIDEEEVEGEMTYNEMKRIAKENGINSHGMKKETLLEAIKEYI